MQTLTINIQDNFLSEFMRYIEQSQGFIEINRDKNLEYDPYFYQRQKELQQIRTDIKNKKIKMISHSQLWKNINNHLETKIVL